MKQITAPEIHQPSAKLEVILFNVGQGDHILLKFPNLEYGIIDFHYEVSSSIKEPPCLSYFKELKRTLPKEAFEKITIAFFCVSHMDKDHVKGIGEAIEWFHNNGVFIREFWLGAARDEVQMTSFLRVKINELVDKFGLDERLRYNADAEKLDKGLNTFYNYFYKWKNKEIKSERYTNEKTGKGEYLCEIRPVGQIGATNIKAVNLGPLGSQLDEYFNNLNAEVIKKILKVKDDNDHVDKNLISHIFKLDFGTSRLIFGGDTDKKIWMECIEQYIEKKFSDSLGGLDSNFIKASHHGSKNSSEKYIWENIISRTGAVCLGISAGRHKSWLHPNSETMKDIRDCVENSVLLSTNACNVCLHESSYSKEYHSWYDQFVSDIRGSKKRSKSESEINRQFAITALNDDTADKAPSQLGLFAYIFEISEDSSEPINIRLAFTKTNKSHGCFFTTHSEKLNNRCVSA